MCVAYSLRQDETKINTGWQGEELPSSRSSGPGREDSALWGGVLQAECPQNDGQLDIFLLVAGNQARRGAWDTD